MHIARSAPTAQATRVRARPENRCTRKGHYVQDGATQGPEDRRRDADANIIFQAGPQVLTGTAPDLGSVLV